MGATVVTKDLDRPRRISRHIRLMTGTVTMSSSYSTGGDTGFDPMPGATYLQVDIENRLGRVLVPDMVNKKVLAYEDGATVAGALDEVPAATNLSTTVTKYKALAKA